MSPRDLCNRLLHNFCVRIRLGKSAHVLEIAGLEAFRLGKGMTKVCRQTVDDLSSPAAPHLLGNELTADVPIKCHRSWLTASAAFTCALRMRSFKSRSKSSYPSTTGDKCSVTTLLLHHSHESLVVIGGSVLSAGDSWRGRL